MKEWDALHGAFPKTIWIARKNASSSEYEQVLRALHEQIEAFASDEERTILVIQ